MIRTGLFGLLLCGIVSAQLSPRGHAAGELQSGRLNGKVVQYQVANGHAAAGDVLLARLDSAGRLPEASAGSKLWTGGVVPYVFDAGFVKKDRMLRAIQQWQEGTGLQFVERTNQANYLKFVSPAFGCNSFVGMQGGEQVLNMADGCYDGAAVHELGHAIGLFHEHTRLDRAQWVRIVKDNIIATCPFEFDFGLAAGSRDLGSYDFGSVMHYDAWASTRNAYPTIQTIPPYIPIGETVTSNTGPSPSDIETVRRMYGRPARGTTIATFPVGLPIIVDGQSFKAPRTFNWAAGSQHTIEVADTVPDDATTRYGFARWSDNGAPSHTVVANADTPVYTANFVRYFKISAAASPAGSGTVVFDPAPADGFYAQGSYVRIEAVGASGRYFERWNGLESFPLSIPEEAGDIFHANPRFFNVNKSKSFQASMLSNPNLVTIATDPANLQVELDGQLAIGPARFAFAPGTAHRLTVRNPIQAGRAGLLEFHSRFVFTGWDGAPIGSTSLDFTAPTTAAGPVTYTAKFKKQFQVDISIFGRGTVDMSPKPVDGYYDEGQIVKFTPQPAAGNRLFDWFGLPASLDALFNSDAPTNNVCASPLVYKMDRPILTSAQMTPPSTTGVKPVITAAAITSAASGAASGVSPGEIVVIYGQNMGPKDLVPGNLSPALRFDNCLGRMVVYFDGVAAPLIYGLAGQVSAIAPYSLAGKSSTQVVVEYKDIRSDAVTVPVLAAKPAFFTANSSGRGAGAFLDLNYQLIGPLSPVARGSYAQLYATGGGQTDPGGDDGALAVDYARLPKLTQPVRVFVGAVEAEVLYAGTAPGAVAGLVQVNIRIPDGAPAGAAVPITLQIGSARSPDGVTIAIR